MAKSDAATAEQYLEELPPDRREIIVVVREVILQNLPPGYVEAMNWGVICYELPLETFADTYNRQPLMVAGVAAQKNYSALYLSCAYQDADEREWLESEFRRLGKKLNMGKGCIRFQKPEDLPLESIGQLLARTTVEVLLERYRAARPERD